MRTGRDNQIRRSARRACASRCHSCVVGLRARLKTERFWFDSRGWHAASIRWVHRRCIASVAQRRVLGSYPRRCWFKSNRRHHADEAARRGTSLPTKIRRVRIPSSAPRCPRSTKVVQLPRKRLALVRFRPRARTRRVRPAGQGYRALNTATRVRFPYTTPTPSSNGSGSEITNLRMVVRVHSESRSWAVIWDQIGFQVRSAGFDPSTARERGKQLTWW